MRWAGALLAALSLASAPAGAQQTGEPETVEQARQQGQAFGREKRNDGSLIPSGDPAAQELPGYQGTDLPQGDYFDDPDRLASEGGASSANHEGYRTVVDSDRTRPRFDPEEIRQTTEAARAVEENPQDHLAGEQFENGQGSCQPLPQSPPTVSYYEASCNTGTRLEQSEQSCRITMDPRVTETATYEYYAEVGGHSGVAPPMSAFDAAIAGGACRVKGAADTCQMIRAYGLTPNGSCSSVQSNIVSCTAQPAVGGRALRYPGTGQYWYAQDVTRTVTMVRNESGCAGQAGNTSCTRTAEVCVDADPATRIIEGVPVTQSCWAWDRTYSCQSTTQATDCGELDANPQCTFLREDCLDDPQDGPCKVQDRVYRCPMPTQGPGETPRWVCGGDVTCINGECETIEREASDEFQDALVALHSLDQAGKEFNEENFTVFSGNRETCHKPVFGLVNCCAGKMSGALTAAAGAAALAGGPAAIAGLATQFLTLFLCSNEEKMLDIRDRMGFCHKVGNYCSESVLGVCITKKTAFCCFESKLSRILQEQGRPQINKPWDHPKRETCEGFTVDEFARLDLSVMDFTEVYAEFTDAVRLPDEVETMTDIQQKIQDYYELHGQQ